MRSLLNILTKEFLLISRDPTILRLIFIMPVMQLVLIPMAADYEVKHISLAIIDQDHSAASQRLVQKVGASGYFRIVAAPKDYTRATTLIESGDVNIALTIPPNFARNLAAPGGASVHLAADAVDGVRAGLGTAYARTMVQQFHQEVMREAGTQATPVIGVTSSNWYNPHSNYPAFMVPGLLVVLVTMVGTFLSSLNIVQEKEAGTIEQINVTPIKKYQFILGKLIPFWLLGMVSITLGIAVARIAFGLWPVGSFVTIYAFAALYLVGVSGIGLLISTFAETQQQATLLSFFFMMIFVLLSGLYTPVESMPTWAQYVAAFNPPAYLVSVMRGIYLKGSGFADLWPSLAKLGGFAVVFNTLAIWNYKKRST